MISTIQIPQETKGPGITSQIIALKVGGKTRAPIEKRPYIGTLISGTIKYKYPERNYTTAIDTEDERFVIIERLEDKEN